MACGWSSGLVAGSSCWPEDPSSVPGVTLLIGLLLGPVPGPLAYAKVTGALFARQARRDARPVDGEAA